MNPIRYVSRRLRRHAEVLRAGLAAIKYRRKWGIPWAKDSMMLPIRALALWRTKTPLKTWKLRLRACRGCQLYDPVNRVCGNADQLLSIELPNVLPDGAFIAPIGCRCKVGVKASYPNAHCFIASIDFPNNFRLPGNWALFNISLDGSSNTKQPREQDK